jgi:transcriptional regulator with XRE-family HTH domain
MEREKIGQWVRLARKHKRWTQAQLAKAMDVTAPNVSHWERDHHRPSHPQLVRISHLTGYALREVASPLDWPLPHVPVQRLANLSPEQLEALQVVMLATLKAMEVSDSYAGFIAALQPELTKPEPKS